MMVIERKGYPGAAPAPPKVNLSRGEVPMLSPHNAWRILLQRTGGQISLSTFYRWISSGKVHSIRVGGHLYVPWPVLDEFISKCWEWGRF